MENFFARFVLSDHKGYRIGRHFFFWVAAWAFQGFIYGFYFVNGYAANHFPISFIESAIFLPQHILLSYGIIYFLFPVYIFKGKYWLGFLGVIFLILITAILSPVITQYVIEPFRMSQNFPVSTKPVFFSFMGGLRGSMTVAGFATTIKLIKLWYLKKQENELLEKERLLAVLQVLKSQLHPHFMFNTLNSIYSLALAKSNATADAILKLSSLLRYMLTECNNPVIPLSTEIQILQNYIDLEKNRFGSRFDIAVNIQGDMKEKTIAPLLLLPFVENAFKHGANEMLEQAWMSLDLAIEDQWIQLKLINGKVRNDHQGLHSSGIGLQNVQKRLELLYPESHELRFSDHEDTFVVILSLQLNKIINQEHENKMLVSG